MKFGDAEVIKSGAAWFDIRDPYTIAVSVRWSTFFGLLLLLEIIINTVFATLYLLDPGCVANARPGSFSDAFFFSLRPLRLLATEPWRALYAHLLSALEVFCGLVFTAIITGLIFVRFSRPRPNILFADHAVISTHNGVPTLMIRVANGRTTAMAGATAQAAMFKPTTSAEGRVFRQALELKLIRDSLPLFILTWTIMHPINEDSPLYELDLKTLSSTDLVIALTVQARDHAVGEDVFSSLLRCVPNQGRHDLQGCHQHRRKWRPNADLSKISHIESEGAAA